MRLQESFFTSLCKINKLYADSCNKNGKSVLNNLINVELIELNIYIAFISLMIAGRRRRR